MVEPFDIGLTLGRLVRGRGDPCARVAGNEWWRAMNTPEGPTTVCVRVSRPDASVTVEAWGAGREWTVQRAHELVGLGDEPRSFTPAHPLLRTLARELRGMRLARVGAVGDLATATIIDQRVTTVEAHRSWRALVHRHGQAAPGPLPLRVPPNAARLGSLPDWQWRRLGIEMRRADAISNVARESARLERAAGEGVLALNRRLRTLRGVGAWTAAHLTHDVLGDPDAVPTGDWHLPGHVGFALTGERDADDARMLELLEPFRPNRARVWRLLLAGAAGPPRRAPHAPIVGLLYAEARRGRTAVTRRSRIGRRESAAHRAR
jgi:3-methyladenine DNA glycosylase/8-oxoguanine DNA glycosylase